MPRDALHVRRRVGVEAASRRAGRAARGPHAARRVAALPAQPPQRGAIDSLSIEKGALTFALHSGKHVSARLLLFS